MLLDKLMLFRVIGSAAAVLIIIILSAFLNAQAKKTRDRFNLRRSRYFAVRRGISLASVCIFLLALVLTWGVDIRNLWVSVTGVVAMVAVAFLAVWSLIGNILAGVLLYFTAPFRVDDYVEILPEKIRGRVLAINTFFTVLHDDDAHYINVPNALFFQKYVVNYRYGPAPAEAGEHAADSAS